MHPWAGRLALYTHLHAEPAPHRPARGGGAKSALCTAQIALVRIVAGLGTVSVAASSLAVNAEGALLYAGLRHAGRGHHHDGARP